jgi:signal transduction histidine kinase
MCHAPTGLRPASRLPGHVADFRELSRSSQCTRQTQLRWRGREENDPGTRFLKLEGRLRRCVTLAWMSERDSDALVQAYAQLLSLAVHELRTPASVVGGYLRMLQRDTDQPLPERHRRLVTEAERSCARLVTLIGELSEVSKLDAGVADVRDEPLDVFELVREVANDVHEAGEREVRLVVRGDETGAQLSGDRTRLGAAFDAFFRAILREQPSGATVDVERRRDQLDGSSAAIVVVACSEHVQDAYAAERSAFDQKRGGLGLALPIACRVVARHGGRVWSPAWGPGNSTSRSAAVIALPIRS